MRHVGDFGEGRRSYVAASMAISSRGGRVIRFSSIDVGSRECLDAIAVIQMVER